VLRRAKAPGGKSRALTFIRFTRSKCTVAARYNRGFPGRTMKDSCIAAQANALAFLSAPKG
jgi:hypothetical protein